LELLAELCQSLDFGISRHKSQASHRRGVLAAELC
jgi:hypothetical protein